MKRIIMIIGVVMLMSNVLFAQTDNQAKMRIHAMWPNEGWQIYPSTVVTPSAADDNAWFLDLQEGDVVYSKIMEVMPGMMIEATLIDTGAVDSVNIQVELQMDMHDVAAEMSTCKILPWDKEGGLVLNQAAILTADDWYSPVGRTEFWSTIYFRLKITALSGHKKLTGVKIKFYVNGDVS